MKPYSVPKRQPPAAKSNLAMNRAFIVGELYMIGVCWYKLLPCVFLAVFDDVVHVVNAPVDDFVEQWDK